MCPLRYVVLFFSLILALVGMVWSNREAEKALSASSGQEAASDVSAASEERKTRAVDFITGRYIYDFFKGKESRHGGVVAGEEPREGVVVGKEKGA